MSNIRYLIFLSICSGIICVTNINKYSRVRSLDGQTCQAGNIVFERGNIVSVTACLEFCARQASCFGISYRQSGQECIGCNEQYLSSNMSDGFENSMFYSRNYCPDDNGKIQLSINFRLQIFKEEKFQPDAELDCGREQNGHLAIFDEEWKINAIENVLLTCAGYDATNYWVDGTRTDRSSAWKFIDERDMPMSDTVFWETDNPNSAYGGKLCSRLRYVETVGYRFNDRQCSATKYHFICEY